MSPDLTGDADDYELIVTATSGWSAAGGATSCVVLRRKITVVSDKKQLILAACLAAVIVIFLGALGYLIHKNRERAKEMLISFLSFEGRLLGEVCLEIWGMHQSARLRA